MLLAYTAEHHAAERRTTGLPPANIDRYLLPAWHSASNSLQQRAAAMLTMLIDVIWLLILLA